MKKIKKLLLTLVLMLFIPIIIAGCGENGIAKMTTEPNTLLTSWEVGRPYDYSTLKLKVVYEDGTTKTITPDTEGVQIVNIDTTTSGEKKLKIKFDGFEKEILINVYDNADQAYSIAGYNPPSFVADYNANKAVSAEEESGFKVNNDMYYIGDDNAFEFMPNITVYKDVNGQPQKLNKYKSNVKVEIKEGTTYTELTGAGLEAMVAVDNENSTFDFTQAAVGSTFKITVKPYYDLDNEIVPITFEFMVKDGYNVHNAHELSVLDNNPNTNVAGVWGDLKEDWGVPSASTYNPKGVYIHGDITLTPADFPETFFINEEEAGANTDNALGTLKQRTSLYSFVSDRNADEFEFCGNYFTIDASAIPLVVRDCSHISGNTAYYREDSGLVTVQGHGSLISFGGDNTQYISRMEDEVQFVGPVKVKNTSFIGNAQKSEDENKTGGLHMIISGAKTFTVENIITQQFLISTTALGCWETEERLAVMMRDDWNDTNNTTTNTNKVIIEDSKFLDAYTTMFYAWGADIEVHDSVLKDAGGPLFMAVHHGDDVNSQYTTINVYDSVTESYVTGTEAWFNAYGANEVATGLVALAQGLKANADGLEAAISEMKETEFKFAKNSMTKSIDGYDKWNFVGLLMQADMAPNKNETRGSINLYETEGTDAVLVGSINAFTTGDDANMRYATYASNPATAASPLFQSVVDGELSTMSSFIDEEYHLGIFNQSFTDCWIGTSTTESLGLTQEDVINMYSGDYLTVFVPGSTLARMACLVTYQRVDA